MRGVVVIVGEEGIYPIKRKRIESLSKEEEKQSDVILDVEQVDKEFQDELEQEHASEVPAGISIEKVKERIHLRNVERAKQKIDEHSDASSGSCAEDDEHASNDEGSSHTCDSNDEESSSGNSTKRKNDQEVSYQAVKPLVKPRHQWHRCASKVETKEISSCPARNLTVKIWLMGCDATSVCRKPLRNLTTANTRYCPCVNAKQKGKNLGFT